MALKSETISLALMTELPLVIVDVQRGGPSTGLPTKTEQSDLLMAMYGRHGEAPLPVVSASSPSDAFDAAIEACRIAVKYMTPVILLSDGYIGNQLRAVASPGRDRHSRPSRPRLPPRSTTTTGTCPICVTPRPCHGPWAVPGTPGLEHRVGGLEKDQLTGNVSYIPANHEAMTIIRENKTKAVANDIPEIEIEDDADAELLVVGWGSTYSAILAGVRNARLEGHKVAHVHLRHLNPFPRNLGEVLARYPKVLVPELNRGQLSRLLRAEYLTPTVSLPKVQGQPFKAAEIKAKIIEMLEA